MLKLELTSQEQHILLDLINAELLALDYLKGEAEYSSKIDFRIQELKNLADSISAAEFITYVENDSTNVYDLVYKMDLRLKEIEKILEDDLK